VCTGRGDPTVHRRHLRDGRPGRRLTWWRPVLTTQRRATRRRTSRRLAESPGRSFRPRRLRCRSCRRSLWCARHCGRLLTPQTARTSGRSVPPRGTVRACT